uniref:Uncharacterized protein n=1 Tax=Tanacetum cinerariifolium TaxID=118510 RepID=A0A6L2MF14_TANCI|nr:hypothetical protein [Tanacetum cinerariifolium]
MSSFIKPDNLDNLRKLFEKQAPGAGEGATCMRMRMSHRKFEHPRYDSLRFLSRKRAACHRGKGKLRFMDDDWDPLVPMGIMEIVSEVEVVFDKTANLRISTSGKDGSDKGYGTNSLLEQWMDSYMDNDDYDPYNDDMKLVPKYIALDGSEQPSGSDVTVGETSNVPPKRHRIRHSDYELCDQKLASAMCKGEHQQASTNAIDFYK